MSDEQQEIRPVSTRRKTITTLILIPAGKAYLVGCFLSGFFHDGFEDEYLLSLPARFVIAGLYFAPTIVYLGFPLADFNQGNRLNAWPYIFICWLVFMSFKLPRLKAFLKKGDLD